MAYYHTSLSDTKHMSGHRRHLTELVVYQSYCVMSSLASVSGGWDAADLNIELTSVLAASGWQYIMMMMS